jgi:DNA invertase Pin-like site-specific DNA recombinase
MCGVFAEFERGMIRERVNAGLARARAKGVRLGRPTTSPDVEARIRKLRSKELELGIRTSVVQRVVAAMEA